MTRKISPVTDNMEKYETYKNLMGRYYKALKNEFYFEALLIDYALLEDRLRSFLYHAGAFANRSSTKITAKRTKDDIKYIVTRYKDADEGDNLGVTSIKGKIKVTKSMLQWCNALDDRENSRYLSALKSQLESLDIQEFLEQLDLIKDWCNYRNEVIHSSLNKNISCLYENLEEQVAKGKQYAEYIDKQIRILKKGNKVRKAANLVIEK